MWLELIWIIYFRSHPPETHTYTRSSPETVLSGGDETAAIIVTDPFLLL